MIEPGPINEREGLRVDLAQVDTLDARPNSGAGRYDTRHTTIHGRQYPAYTGTVSVDPFFAKIIASSRAGCVALAFFETSCVAPGCS